MGEMDGLGPALRLMMWLALVGAIALFAGGIYLLIWIALHVRFA